MQNPLTHYTVLAKRWAWVILLGIVLCGGSTYIIAKLMHPVYQATTLLLVSFNTTSSGYDNTTAALEILPTYAQIVTNPTVLQPVLAQHQGLTLQQLTSMISVKPQSNTQIIELDVSSTDPQLAAQLANEVGQSIASYSNTKLAATVQVLPALAPTDPIQPKPGPDALLGAMVGLGLALGLIVVFEWLDDRIANPEEIHELLNVDILTTIPHLSRNQRARNAEEIPALAEGCRILSATLNTAQQNKPFKMVMVTSALAGEGKSTIAANLASFLAMSGKYVLLVDADLRHPVLDQHFQLDNQQGLSNVFLEMWAQIQVELEGQSTEIETLHVLPAGVIPANPVELLQSKFAGQLFEHFKESSFDYIIFDTSPLLPVADTRILASYVDATILVVDVSKTPRKILTQARQILRQTPTTLLGVTVNKSPWSAHGDIRDYLTSIQQQRPKADISLSIPPYRRLDIPTANRMPTSNQQRAKDSKDMPTAPNANVSPTIGVLNEHNLNDAATASPRVSNTPHVERKWENMKKTPTPPSPRVPHRPYVESAPSEQKRQTDRPTTPIMPDTSQFNATNEQNEPEPKADNAKLSSLNTTDVTGIPVDLRTTAHLPQPQKRNQ